VPVGMSWMWTLAFGHHEDRTPTHGYDDTGGRDGGVRQEAGLQRRDRLDLVAPIHTASDLNAGK